MHGPPQFFWRIRNANNICDSGYDTLSEDCGFAQSFVKSKLSKFLASPGVSFMS